MATPINPGFPVQPPLRLNLLGANERMRNTLAMVLDGPARGKGVLTDSADVDAIIVDMDSVGAEAEWASYRKRFPDRPALILTVAPRDIEHATVVLRKPFTIGGLVDAISCRMARMPPSRIIIATCMSERGRF